MTIIKFKIIMEKYQFKDKKIKVNKNSKDNQINKE